MSGCKASNNARFADESAVESDAAISIVLIAVLISSSLNDGSFKYASFSLLINTSSFSFESFLSLNICQK